MHIYIYYIIRSFVKYIRVKVFKYFLSNQIRILNTFKKSTRTWDKNESIRFGLFIIEDKTKRYANNLKTSEIIRNHLWKYFKLSPISTAIIFCTFKKFLLQDCGELVTVYAFCAPQRPLGGGGKRKRKGKR